MKRAPQRLPPKFWQNWPDEKLLKLKFSELLISVEDCPLLKKCIKKLCAELGGKNISFRPHFWLSNEWFTPDTVAGIAIPFYLAHPRLAKLELNQMLEVEGRDEKSCMKILRHETGHSLENAFTLKKERKVNQVFGSFAKTYPKFYTPKPYSRKFVLHLDTWYSQSHPFEDFAETFAVWLTPGSDWRIRYIGWPALKKLEFMDSLMADISVRKPALRSRRAVDPIESLRKTLGQHYEERRQLFGLNYPNFYDRDLCRLFSDDPISNQKMTAATFLRKVKREVRRKVSFWTGTYQYLINNVIDDMVKRSEDLQLYLRNSEEQTVQDFTVLLTVQTMNYLHSGKHRVAL